MTQHVFTFETGVATDPGKVRDVNEDGSFASAEAGVWVIADGMGGHTNGKLASSKIVEASATIGRAASAPDLLARFYDRMLRTNREIQAISGDSGGVMGATVAAVLVYGNHCACVWSGDSRVYLVRSGAITQLSRDHTEVQGLVDQGLLTSEEARNWPRRNVITRAIGVFDDPELETVHGKVSPGDRFVLCSDGLTGHVSDAEILDIADNFAAQDACDRLVGLTLGRGALDNVTVMIARCLPRQQDDAPTAVPGRLARAQ